LLLAGANDAALAWGIAAVFIPSFALASGILSGNRRLFEGVFIAWWLIGPMASKGTVLDFLGVHQEVIACGVHWYYLCASMLLILLAYVGRWRQLCPGSSLFTGQRGFLILTAEFFNPNPGKNRRGHTSLKPGS